MTKTTNPELCSLITNVCKLPKNFDFPEIMQPFRFVWFEECPWVCYSWWEDETYCLPCVLFGYKKWESLYKTLYLTWETVVKIFKKHRYVPTGTHKKEVYYFIDF